MARSSRRLWIVAVVLMAGGLGTCTLCGIGYYFYRQDQDAFAGLGRACDGQAIADAAAYRAGDRANRFFAYEHQPASGSWSWVFGLARNDVRARSRREASVVLCAEPPQDVLLGRCQITTTGGSGVGVRVLGIPVASVGGGTDTTTYERTRKSRHVRAVEARTGRTIKEGDVLGAEPAACEGPWGGDPSRSTFTGGDVTGDDVQTWFDAAATGSGTPKG